MNTHKNNQQIKPGEFPFPLTGGPNESCFLTWLRNHSNYMAVRGFLDYLRMASVLVRGILINNLAILPTLLMIAFAIGFIYGGLLDDWNDQVGQELTERQKALSEKEAVQEAEQAQKTEIRPADNVKEAKTVREESDERVTKANGTQENPFFLMKKTVSGKLGWVTWMQDYLGLTPPFLLTPVVLAIAALWVLLFPILMMLTKIAGYHKSLATGSDSSVRSRDRLERSFGAALLVILAVVLFELLPLMVHFYHSLRLRHLDHSWHWGEYFAAATAILCALSSAPKLLSVLSGAWQKLAMAFIALLGLLVPLMVIVLVADFLVFTPMPVENYLGDLVLIYWLTPGLYSLVILIALLIGIFRQTFSGREILRLLALLISMIAAHVILFAAMLGVWSLFFSMSENQLEVFVPDIFLAVDNLRGHSFGTYGDLAPYVVVGGALEIWLFCWLTVDINLTSIHGLYRDRLASAYLLGRNAHGQVDIEEDVPLQDLCYHETGSIAPYHLINVALNLQGSKDIGLRDRYSDLFIFSKKFIGSARTGYCRSATMEQVFPQIDLASAMAISAAAAAPNMGRSTSPALVVFMTLINVRLGVWIPNPGLLEESLVQRKVHQRTKARLTGGQTGFTFDEVFHYELASIKKRWEQLGPRGTERRLDEDKTAPSPSHRLAGIGFSGGGIRSATLNLGIAQALHFTGVFDHFDYMSTVSGGGYLGSSISALMRHKFSPISEIAGTVTVEMTTAGDKIVTITPKQNREARIYRFSEDAEVTVNNGDWVKRGTRLIRRSGPRLRSQVAGIVSVEMLTGGQQVVRISGGQPVVTREYRYTKYDQLTVKSGDSIEVGHLLIKEQNSFGNRFRWRVRPKALLREMTMRLDETHRWVNLSDGGHIENLAAIELLRRRCMLIVIGDGEADPNLHFNGLATLMRTARLDLGVHIDICLDNLRLDASRKSQRHLAIGRIRYPEEREYGYLLYLKSSYTGDEEEVISEYRQRNPAFPHESTADQFFDEGQFEAYRALGQHIGEQAIKALALQNHADNRIGFTEFARGFQALWEREEKKNT